MKFSFIKRKATAVNKICFKISTDWFNCLLSQPFDNTSRYKVLTTDFQNLNDQLRRYLYM